MKLVAAEVVRRVIAHLMRPRAPIEGTLGQIDLRAHQLAGVSHIMDAFRDYGGALLCDEVGLGKTYTAAAVAKLAGPATVIAPAALAEMWRDSLARVGADWPVISLERFSRSKPGASGASLVIIDEAHHLRNRNTVRFHNVAQFIGCAKVLLLSATPVHNRRGDVLSLLSLFLGSRASSLDPADESRCIIRRRKNSVRLQDLPTRIHCPGATPPVSGEIRRMLLALPPPVPPRSADDCAALVQFTLLRQWASSDAALTSALRIRLARAHAMIAALEAGTFPTRKELLKWITSDAHVQLGFSELLASSGGSPELLHAVRRHQSASEQLLRYLRSVPSSDNWRADYLRSLRTLYAGRKIVAFTQFASTARELYRLLKWDAKVALVTSRRCEIASGAVARDDVIRRFAPMAAGCSEPPEREAITLLVTTDLCSEGLNLQDAGVVVHLDLPWTPARIEQRIGRIARTGSQYREVFVHTLRIPVIADDLLQLERRLKTKRALGETVIGTTEETSETPSLADAAEQVRNFLAGWEGQALVDAGDLVIASVDSEPQCFLAVVGGASGVELVCELGNNISSDPRDILRCLKAFTSVEVTVSSSDVFAITARMQSWLEQRRLEIQLKPATSSATMHKFLSRKLNQAVTRAPAHQKAANALRADRVHRTLSRFRGAGQEFRMMNLAMSSGEIDWLEDLVTLAEGDGNEKAEPERSGFKLLALLVGQSPRRR